MSDSFFPQSPPDHKPLPSARGRALSFASATGRAKAAASTDYGVRLPNSGPFADASTILRLAVHAEELGFDTVWVHDHISWAREKLTHFAAGSIEACQDQDPNFFESVATAGVLAGRLRRASIAIAGLVLPLRDPRVLAKQLATVQSFAGRPLTVALGVGAIAQDFQVMNVPWNRRGRIANDYLGALRAILDGEQPVSYESANVSFSGGEFYPRPTDLRLWIAGTSDAALTRAVRYGEGWMTVYATPAEYAEHLGRLQAKAAELGRDPSTLATGLEFYMTVGATRAEALRIAERSLVHKFKSIERGLAVSVVGDRAEVADQFAAFREAGVQHFELKFVCHDPDQMARMMERVSDVVAPAAAR